MSPFAGTVEEIVSMVFSFCRIESLSAPAEGQDKSANTTHTPSSRVNFSKQVTMAASFTLFNCRLGNSSESRLCGLLRSLRGFVQVHGMRGGVLPGITASDFANF